MKVLPNADERVSEDGVLTEQARLYLLQLGELLIGEIPLIMPRYANRNALEAAVINPVENQIAGTVDTAVGLVIRLNSDWVDSDGDAVPP